MSLAKVDIKYWVERQRDFAMFPMLAVVWAMMVKVPGVAPRVVPLEMAARDTGGTGRPAESSRGTRIIRSSRMSRKCRCRSSRAVMSAVDETN